MLELAVIIPTRNERKNVEPLLARVGAVLEGIEWEAIFVDDDSPDGTADLVRSISLRDPRVRVIHRIGRRGLASAVIEGMLATAAPYMAVIDGDLQHDEGILPRMFQTLSAGNVDVVVASRNTEGGSMGKFSRSRVFLSNLGRKLSEFICRTELSDPMSGFFMLRRSYFEEVSHNLSGLGFKILVDLLASSRQPVRVAEVPYTFRDRLEGESKLDAAVSLEYLLLLADKTMGRWIPVRFVLFGLVGLIGLFIHFAVIGILHYKTSVPFAQAQMIGTVLAMTSNFLLNNGITYRDRRLKGVAIVWGLLSFCVACSVGVVINLALARMLVGAGVPWYFASLAGIAVSSVWNFGMTAVFTWRRQQQSARRAPVRALPVSPSPVHSGEVR